MDIVAGHCAASFGERLLQNKNRGFFTTWLSILRYPSRVIATGPKTGNDTSPDTSPDTGNNTGNDAGNNTISDKRNGEGIGAHCWQG